jgi:hypothetical protein
MLMIGGSCTSEQSGVVAYVNPLNPRARAPAAHLLQYSTFWGTKGLAGPFRTQDSVALSVEAFADSTTIFMIRRVPGIGMRG